MSERILGIDFGTANSAAAVWVGEKEDYIVVESAEGATPIGTKAFPSYVAFNKAGDYKSAGIPALKRADKYPEETICNIKRIIGRSYDDAVEEINKFLYKNNVHRGNRGEIVIRLGKHEYSTEDIAKFLIEKIKKDAEEYLKDEGFLERDEEIKKAVITTPAYFGPDQITAIRNAGQAAGFKNIEMLPEPIAAAKAYALKVESEQAVMVVDLGAGTLDVTVVTMFRDDAGDYIMKDEGTHGHRSLGGLDMDREIIKYLKEEFGKYDRSYDITKDVEAMGPLKYAAEHAKITLSSQLDAPITIQYDGGRKTWTTKLSRNKLEELVKDIVDKCRGPIQEALHRSGKKQEEIDRVLLVGGPMHMPIVRNMIIDEFKRNKKVVEELKQFEKNRQVDPMECVAIGAALGGETISKGQKGDPIILTTPSGYGILLGDTVDIIIKQGTIYRPGGAKAQSYYFAGSTESSIPIIEVQEDEKTSTATYQDLGRLKIVLSSLEDSRVDVTFKVNENKELDVTFHHSTIGEIPYEKVNYGGKPIDILEHALENTEGLIDAVNGLKGFINKPEVVEECVRDLKNELKTVPTNRDDISGREKRELADKILRKKSTLVKLHQMIREKIGEVIIGVPKGDDGGIKLPPLNEVILHARQLLRVAKSNGITGKAISDLEVELNKPNNVARILSLMAAAQHSFEAAGVSINKY